MSELKKYEYHDLSNFYELMEGAEFNALVDDIKKNGLIESITLFEGKILDGRNRYRACQKLGISCKYKKLPKGVTAFNYVVLENERRRHHNSAQKAEVGLKIWEYKKEEIKKEKSKKAKAQREREEKEKNGVLSPKPKIQKSKPRNARAETAKEHGISDKTLIKAKTITKIAETDKLIADEWNKAKKGETSIELVYQQAQIIEIISPMPAPYKHKIRAELEAKDKSIKQIKIEIGYKKDNLKRAEIASNDRALAKRNKEMENRRLKRNKLEDTISEIKGDYKQTKVMLKLFSNETVEKYPNIKSNNPNIKSNDPDVVVQFLGDYDTIDVKVFNNQLKILKSKYNELEKPLRDELLILESEYKTKKEAIDKQKADTSLESVWIEKQLELMSIEYNKQELYEEIIKKNKKELNELQEKYYDN